jgi:ribosomal protein S27E
MTDNVTHLPRRKRGEPTGPLEVVQKYGDCRHMNIDVCEKEAEVTCRDCKTKLNPIWVLMRIAQDDRILVDRWAGMKAEMRLMGERTRTKCRHCQKFTPIPSHATSAEVFELTQKIKREEMP